MLGAGAPFRVLNLPPMTTRLPSGDRTIAETSLSSAFGAQGRSAPLLDCAAARRIRAAPFTEEKLPPNHTVELLAAIPLTLLLALGAKDVTNELSLVLNAAMWPRAMPST